jgi:hypothetical protein
VSRLPAFASYRAVSAAADSSRTPATPAVLCAAPMDTVTVMVVRPSAVSFAVAAIAARNRSASWASSPVVTAGRATANSSPPILPTISVARTERSSDAPTARSMASPVRWLRVVDDLESVDVDHGDSGPDTVGARRFVHRRAECRGGAWASRRR